MKKSLLVTLLLFCSLTLNSQDHRFSLGFSVGTTISSIKIENYLDVDYGFNLGFGGELFCELNLNPQFFIMTNVGILERGYVYDNETVLIIVTDETENSYLGSEFKMDHFYLNNDWLFGYQFGKEIHVSISAGVYYSYYLGSRSYSRNYIYIDPIEHSIIDDPALPIGYSEYENYAEGRNQMTYDWDLGIVGCIGLGYMITDKFTIGISGKYHHSLQDISYMRLIEEVSIYNRSIVTFAGIKVTL